ncbi:MAG: hypothetical protein CBB71_11530 [Rhodopirellula sp. TMED11]|nr:MAG: hypothetical protein CBB71_16505 [Rhodopirellula sp. TMED11]OUT59142.1 MAG: hypothetical protein CBB71_11530 [Rhodopirellula sp. TMED11]
MGPKARSMRSPQPGRLIQDRHSWPQAVGGEVHRVSSRPGDKSAGSPRARGCQACSALFPSLQRPVANQAFYAVQ